MTEPTCAFCRFYDDGLCRAHPPLKAIHDNQEDLWPCVREEDWCGEFELGFQDTDGYRRGTGLDPPRPDTASDVMDAAQELIDTLPENQDSPRRRALRKALKRHDEGKP